MHYLAYGSNLHPQRLALRVPNSRLLGTVKLDGYSLTFKKRSTDGSSKCNMDFTGKFGHVVHAAIYEIPEDEVHDLDAAEGLGAGYSKEQISVTVNGESLSAFAYLASPSHLVTGLEPYHWYKGFVLAGARKHEFPAAYLQQIAAVTSKSDPKDSRRIEMEKLLVQLEG